MTHETEEPEEQSSGFQWTWVLLSLIVYMIFYFLPLMVVPGGMLAGGVATDVTLYVTGIWGTAGVFIISAILAYFSPGITVWEAVVSAVGVVLLMAIVVSLETNRLIVATIDDALGFGIMLVVVFGMAYMGGWWGEKMQNIRDIIEDYPMEIEGAAEKESDPNTNAGREEEK